MRVDYTSLSLPVTQQDMQKYASKDKPLTVKSAAVIGGILWLLICIPVIINGVTSSTRLSGSMVAMPIVVAFIMAGVVAAAVYGSGLMAMRSAKLRRFAEINNAIFTQNVANPRLSGMIFDEGHTRMLEESISFPEGIEIGNYSYITGTGKSSVGHDYTFARVSLNRNLPHMVLDAKTNNFLGTNLPDSFNTGQRLKLEGDFNNHFNVYVPQGYETDALYVFTPDVMLALVEQGKGFDMEIIGNELLFYKSGKINLTSQNELETLLVVINAVTDELKDQSKRYVDERASSQSVTHSNQQMPQIAAEGRRLRSSVNMLPVAFLIGLVIIIVLPPLLPARVSDIFVLVSWPSLFVALAIYMLALYIRSRK